MIILISPWYLVEAAVRMFWEIGEVDWAVLLKPWPDYEDAVASGQVFNDDLATIQRAQNRKNLKAFEDYSGQTRMQFETLFRSGSGRLMTLDEIIAQTRTMDLVQRNARYYCESILGRPVNSGDLKRFTGVFLPMSAMIYAFLFAHYYRNKPEPTSKAAGAIDLLAAVYLPICHRFVTDDREQQEVLRDVAQCCLFQSEVVWFDGVFRKRFLS